ncbi:hypothetical protein IWZ01DRAFT_511357 [Phyllosticta capitalensis]
MGDGRPRWTFGWDGMVVSLFAFFVLGCRRGVPNSLNASLNFVFFFFSTFPRLPKTSPFSKTSNLCN